MYMDDLRSDKSLEKGVDSDEEVVLRKKC